MLFTQFASPSGRAL